MYYSSSSWKDLLGLSFDIDVKILEDIKRQHHADEKASNVLAESYVEFEKLSTNERLSIVQVTFDSAIAKFLKELGKGKIPNHFILTIPSNEKFISNEENLFNSDKKKILKRKFIRAFQKSFDEYLNKTKAPKKSRIKKFFSSKALPHIVDLLLSEKFAEADFRRVDDFNFVVTH